MKLLFDQNLSYKLCQRLADLFPGSSQVRLLGLREADDQAVWHYAQASKNRLKESIACRVATWFAVGDYFNDAMSMTNRYRTSPWSTRS